MLSKNKIKFFNSLKLRKYRLKHNLFLSEGKKLTLDLLQSEIKPKYILTSIKDFPFELKDNTVEIFEASASEIKKISSLKTPPELIGIFEIPHYLPDYSEIKHSLSLFCDDIQNPGNLGTIIRTADWYGIKNVFCSKGTVDVYNPKTVQASMGALASVKTCYVDKSVFFMTTEKSVPVYGTFPEGENIYESTLSHKGIIIIGNEGQGISEELFPYITKKISIPTFNKEGKNTESLNAAVANAIICSEFKRRS